MSGVDPKKVRRPRAAPVRCDVKWRGSVPAKCGPVNVYVAFAPNRARVKSASLGGVAASELVAGKPSILRFADVSLDGADKLVFTTDAYGERPLVSAVSIQPRGAPDADAVGGRDLQEQLDRQWRDVLDERAGRRFDLHAVESAFFLQFDAWTNPAIAERLVERQFDAFRSSLGPRARAMFVEPLAQLPFPFEQAEALTDVASSLYSVAETRGYKLTEGKFGPFEMGEIAPERLNPAKDPVAAVDRIAIYLEAMFLKLLGTEGNEEKPGVALTPLERCFALFAGGHLAFVDPTVEDDIQSAINCEPDSIYFFCFAEFALMACEREPPGPSWWFPIARLFVALQDVFTRTYGPRLGLRRFDAYARKNRASPLLEEEAIVAHVRQFKTDYRDRTALRDLLEIHASNLLHAARDEIFKGKALAATG